MAGDQTPIMNDLDLKKSIETALKAFATKPMAEAATGLFDVLGYRSEKRLALKPNTPKNFLDTFGRERPFNSEQALMSEWLSVDFLFQLTDEEVRAVALGDQSSFFGSSNAYDGEAFESYLFFAIGLKPRTYTRTELSTITRVVNRLFSMPVFLLFCHGDSATLSVIRRRLHKRDESKDVLEKITLIKDIDLADPIRAHIEILYDLDIQVLFDEYRFHNFVGLHQAWEKRLGSYALNERFYREISSWYFWAMGHKDVTLPRAIEGLRDKGEREKQRSVFFIRLLTRLIFCWFLQEKRLIPRDLFRARTAENLLKDPTPKGGTYYKAFLQNLFFGTLNQEQKERDWRKEYEKSTRKGNRGATNLWRYRDLLKAPPLLESLLRDQIPFVNGGLFDCLDQVFQEKEGQQDIRLDDFSEEKGNKLYLPNELFFGEERALDLSEVYDDQRRKREKVRGLMETLSRYKFTVEENTRLEEEIALDPELLGKVFENLLASYNEDTRTTARKALGGFYTPREIVSYMVDEALIAYLRTSIENDFGSRESESRLRSLFRSHATAFSNPFDLDETSALISAIGRVKILDPACGSGAFPMGALHRLVNLLQKLDPNNESWKRDRLAEAERYRDNVLRQSDATSEEVNQCEARIDDIRKSFEEQHHALDFARKLYIIENSIYGVDIQPIATQIAKLRFFIALIVEQRVNPSINNLGVRPLPNLETKIVAADALIPLDKPHGQMDLLDTAIRPLRRQLEQVRHEHFNARTPSAKARFRQRDAELRIKIAEMLKQNGLPAAEAKMLAAWDPYDQNHAAPFFDTEWMFGLAVGGNGASGNETAATAQIFSASAFDVVVGNPPYVRQEQIRHLKPLLKPYYECFTGTADLYVYFYERSIRLLKPGGIFSFITSNKWFRVAYGEKLRGWLPRHTRILQLVDFGDAPVFTAIAYPCIVLLQRTKNSKALGQIKIEALAWQPGPAIETFGDVFRQNHFLIPQHSLKADSWQIENPSKLLFLDRMRASGKPLREVIGSSVCRGITTGFNGAFVIDRATRDLIIGADRASADLMKPWLRGRDVKRWHVRSDDLWLLFVPWHFPLMQDKSITGASPKAEREFVKRYPAVFEHLHRFKKELSGRNKDETGIRYEWYALQRWGAEYWEEFQRPKIISTKVSIRPTFALDVGGSYLGNTTYFFPISSGGKFILGLLNSNLFHAYAKRVFVEKQGGWYEVQPAGLESFPVPAATAQQQGTVELVVSYLLWLSLTLMEDKASNPRDTLMSAYWEQLLNGLVYELFFPDELYVHGLRLFDVVTATSLPNLEVLPESDRLLRLRAEFERTYATDHPLRGALSALRSLEIVRTVEGES
jgi:hypothetical protein